MQLQNVRIAFPDLWKARAFNEGQDPKFGATFIFPKDHPQIPEIKAEIQKAALNKWGEQEGPQILQQLLAQGRVSFRDGMEKANQDGFDDSVLFISSSNTKRPGIYHQDRTPLKEEDGVIYAGCYVNALIEWWAQDNKYGKRINASLRGVQFVDDGPAFGGGGSPASPDEFPDQGPPQQPAPQSMPGWEPPQPQQPAPGQDGTFPQQGQAAPPQQPAQPAQQPQQPQQPNQGGPDTPWHTG